MFHPDVRVSATVAALVLAAIIVGIWRHRQIAPEKTAAGADRSGRAPSGDLAPILAEAKRDVG
jgi:hypothetical protein